jgi:carbon-monoxide dehydrogenase medium subunit
MVGVAAVVTLDGGGTVQTARVAMTGLASHPMRLTGVESVLAGKAATPEGIEAAARKAVDGLELRDAIGGEAFKYNLAAVYTRRALARAVERARTG